MPSIDDIVLVTITKEGFAVSRAGFGTPLHVVSHVVTANRVDLYADLAEMVAAGFVSTDPAYLLAQASFAQTPSPSVVGIGRIDAGDAAVTDTMDAIEAASPDNWYSFTHTTRAEADLLLLAAWAETRNRLYFAQSSDAVILTNTPGNVFEDLANADYSRTVPLYHALDTDYLDASACARLLVSDMDAINGAITLANKRLAGLTPDALSTTERNNVAANNGNVFEVRGGESILREGTTSTGEFADVIMTIDWLTARLTEDVFALLVGTSTKIPYTQSGIDAIEGAVEARLTIAVSNGHLISFSVTVPAVGDVSSDDKNTRILRNVSFTGTLQGAIHSVVMSGKVAA